MGSLANAHSIGAILIFDPGTVSVLPTIMRLRPPLKAIGPGYPQSSPLGALPRRVFLGF